MPSRVCIKRALSCAGRERRQRNERKGDTTESSRTCWNCRENENIRQMVEGIRGRVPLAGSAMWKIKRVDAKRGRRISGSPDGRRESLPSAAAAGARSKSERSWNSAASALSVLETRRFTRGVVSTLTWTLFFRLSAHD